MRLVYEKTGIEVQVGDIVETIRGLKVRVHSFDKPHKPDSEGKIMVEGAVDGGPGFLGKVNYYTGVIGAQWIEREDREPQTATRKGKTLKTVPDGAPRRLADFKNAWRKMTDEQRAEAARFIWQEGPTLDHHTKMVLKDGF